MTSPTFPYTHEIERGETLIEICGEYTVSKYYAETHLQPAEGGDVELLTVKRDGRDFDLTDAEEAALVDALQIQSVDDLDTASGDEGDYRYEQWKDDKMRGL